MADPTGTKINGIVHDWSSIETDLEGFEYANLKELNYKDSLDVGKRRGRSGKVTGTTHGDYDAEGDFALPKSDSDHMIQNLAAKRASGDGFGLVSFTYTVHYSDQNADGTPGPTITDILTGCRVVENDSSNSQGNEDSVMKHSIFIREISWNGKRMSDIDE